MEQLPPPRGLLRRPVHRTGAAHPQRPGLGRGVGLSDPGCRRPRRAGRPRSARRSSSRPSRYLPRRRRTSSSSTPRCPRRRSAGVLAYEDLLRTARPTHYPRPAHRRVAADGALLHLGHHRAPQRCALHPSLHLPARPGRHLPCRHVDRAGRCGASAGADVPRQRLGHALRGGSRRGQAGLLRRCARPPGLRRSAGRTRGSPSRPGCPPSGSASPTSWSDAGSASLRSATSSAVGHSRPAR